MNIEVGMYCRNQDGIIGKVYHITYEPECDIGIAVYPEVNAVWLDDDKKQYIEEETIIKASHNIIDLIEYMDLVTFNESIKVISHKGEEYIVSFLEPQFIEGFATVENENYIMIGLDRLAKISDLTNDKIRAVLTHEQIKQNQYEIKGE